MLEFFKRLFSGADAPPRAAPDEHGAQAPLAAGRAEGAAADAPAVFEVSETDWSEWEDSVNARDSQWSEMDTQPLPAMPDKPKARNVADDDAFSRIRRRDG